MKKNQYEIAGYCVSMTDEQASRWNAGEWTSEDEQAIEVAVLRISTTRDVPLADVPADVRQDMEGFPANRISGGA